MRIWWTNPRLSMDDVKKKKERSVVPKLAKEKKKANTTLSKRCTLY